MASAFRIATVLSSAVGAVAIGASMTLAPDAAAQPESSAAIADVETLPPAEQPINFNDPHAALEHASRSASLSLGASDGARFSQPEPANTRISDSARGLQFEVAANGGAPLDISFAHRATLGVDPNGDIASRGRGSELRVGRGLVQQRQPDPDGRSVYVFVASDDEALTWRPGARAEGVGPSLTLEDRVEVGDMSAGITYERNGVQASLAYVEREISAEVGRQSFSEAERFAGVTVTMRR